MGKQSDNKQTRPLTHRQSLESDVTVMTDFKQHLSQSACLLQTCSRSFFWGHHHQLLLPHVCQRQPTDVPPVRLYKRVRSLHDSTGSVKRHWSKRHCYFVRRTLRLSAPSLHHGCKEKVYHEEEPEEKRQQQRRDALSPSHLMETRKLLQAPSHDQSSDDGRVALLPLALAEPQQYYGCSSQQRQGHWPAATTLDQQF